MGLRGDERLLRRRRWRHLELAVEVGGDLAVHDSAHPGPEEPGHVAALAAGFQQSSGAAPEGSEHGRLFLRALRLHFRLPDSRHRPGQVRLNFHRAHANLVIQNAALAADRGRGDELALRIFFSEAEAKCPAVDFAVAVSALAAEVGGPSPTFTGSRASAAGGRPAFERGMGGLSACGSDSAISRSRP